MDYNELKALYAKRARVWEQAKALLDDTRDAEWTSEHEKQHADLETEMARYDREIDHAERERKLDARDEAIHEEREEEGTPQERYNLVFDKWTRGGMPSLERDEREVLQTGFESHDRAQSVGTGSAGGFTVPQGFMNRIQETLLAFSDLASTVNVITTATGNDLPWPTNDDTANEGAILTENTQITEQDVTFGTKQINAYLYTSKLIRVSYQLLQDSAFDIEGFLARKMGERLARIYNRHWTVGTGAAQPDGIAVSPTTGVTAASATVWTHDELIDLQHSVDPAYRGNNAKWMFNDTSLGEMRKLVDGNGNKAWAPGLTPGIPSTLLGNPYIINQNMPSQATGNVAVLFGDFHTGYIIRQVRGVQSVRLDERYADFLQVGFFAFGRMDGTKDDTAAYKAGVMA